jgi:hypothetical protein
MTIPPQAWNPDIPADVYTSELVTDGPVINSNWNCIGNTYAVDHVPLGSTTVGTVGYHNQVTFATQSTAPTADPTNLRIFSQIPSGSTVPQLYLQFPTSSGILLPLLLSSTAVTCPAYTTGSWTVQEVDVVIDGVQVKLGWITTNSTSPLPAFITFGGQATPNPFPNSLSFAGLLTQSINGNPVLSNASTSGCRIATGGLGASLLPFSIGYFAWGN